MTFEVAFLDSFRGRFAEKEPPARHLVRRVTKFDLYLAVRDLVDQHRANGYAWEGIAEVFRELGVPISASTLKTCARRARAKSPRASSARAPRRSTADRPIVASPGSEAQTRPDPLPPTDGLGSQATVLPELAPSESRDGHRGSGKDTLVPGPSRAPAATVGTVEGAMAVRDEPPSTPSPCAMGPIEAAAPEGNPSVAADGHRGQTDSPSAPVAPLAGSSLAGSRTEQRLETPPISAPTRSRPARRMAFEPQRDSDL